MLLFYTVVGYLYLFLIGLPMFFITGNASWLGE